MAWGGFLDKLLEKLPIQGRVERWKNELENLKHERQDLYDGEASIKASQRLTIVNTRIDYLDQLLKNKATD